MATLNIQIEIADSPSEAAEGYAIQKLLKYGAAEAGVMKIRS